LATKAWEYFLGDEFALRAPGPSAAESDFIEDDPATPRVLIVDDERLSPIQQRLSSVLPDSGQGRRMTVGKHWKQLVRFIPITFSQM
jgi:hypothetical protein